MIDLNLIQDFTNYKIDTEYLSSDIYLTHELCGGYISSSTNYSKFPSLINGESIATIINLIVTHEKSCNVSHSNTS